MRIFHIKHSYMWTHTDLYAYQHIQTFFVHAYVYAHTHTP